MAATKFEAPEVLTLGTVNERASRFAGGAYSPFLKKVHRFGDCTLPVALREREGWVSRLLAIDADPKERSSRVSTRCGKVTLAQVAAVPRGG